MEKTFKILNEEGMHARPAGALVKVAGEFKSVIEISAKGQKKSAKSIMGIMTLGLAFGDEVIITANGEDEAAALTKIGELIQNKFQL